METKKELRPGDEHVFVQGDLYVRLPNGRYKPWWNGEGIRPSDPHYYESLPCDGLWMVETLPGSRHSRCIKAHFLGDLPEAIPHAAAARHYDIAVESLRKLIDDTKKETYRKDSEGQESWRGPSISQMVDAVLGAIGEEEAKNKEG